MPRREIMEEFSDHGSYGEDQGERGDVAAAWANLVWKTRLYHVTHFLLVFAPAGGRKDPGNVLG